MASDRVFTAFDKDSSLNYGDYTTYLLIKHISLLALEVMFDL